MPKPAFVPEYMLALRPLLAFAVAAGCAATAHADNWPAWRGPTGQGHSDEKSVPLMWGGKDKANVKWKVPLAHPGNSTPVVRGDNLFLSLPAGRPYTPQSTLATLYTVLGLVLPEPDAAGAVGFAASRFLPGGLRRIRTHRESGEIHAGYRPPVC